MDQFIPTVTKKDVERILTRDYLPEKHEEIRLLISNITCQEKYRVTVACFKNSNKDFKRLVYELNNADGYWREAIADAEYPKIKKAKQLTDGEINEKRKVLYLQWFNL